MAKLAAPKVAILGGGVAGMSAAHELVERGFLVEVFERKAVPGGKARSVAATTEMGRSPAGPRERSGTTSRNNGPPPPGEHGFRFFPGFYRHVIDTMARIPFGPSGTVRDNLVDTAEIRFAPFDRPSFTLPVEFPRGPQDLRIDLFSVIGVLAGNAGVGPVDTLFFATKIWEFVTSCAERRLVDYERVSWWDFIEADTRSAEYQKYFGQAITRSLVAAKARRASTKTIGDIFVQILLKIVRPGTTADRLLNGPTSDVWITPWLDYLRWRGVKYHLDAQVERVTCVRGLVRSATVVVGDVAREITADYFVCALPVERMVELISPALLEADPSLANLRALTDYVEWMNGIQYYLRRDVRISDGHTIYVDSPWALTSVSQAQFWRDFDLAQYGDRSIRGILSVDVSDWDVEGMNGKQARFCGRDEIAREVWAQLKRSLNSDQNILEDDNLHSWFLDPDIQVSGEGASFVDTNAEPLLVNYVDTWRLRPDATTRIPNLFLASDYVRTFTDLATMEAANEAARRAVNGIVQASRSDEPLCEIWNLHEPCVLEPFRAYDRVRFRQGFPWDGRLVEPVRVALEALSAEASSKHSPADVAAALARRTADEARHAVRGWGSA